MSFNVTVILLLERQFSLAPFPLFVIKPLIPDGPKKCPRFKALLLKGYIACMLSVFFGYYSLTKINKKIVVVYFIFMTY